MPLEVVAIAGFHWRLNLKMTQLVFELLLCACNEADVAPAYVEPWASQVREMATLQTGPQCRMHNTDYREADEGHLF